jgi:hypothetical protein
MDENTRKKFEELEKLARPVQKWLQENFDPYHRVEIDIDGATVITEKMGLPMPLEYD